MTTAHRLPRPAREELAGIEYVKIGECINDQGAKIVMRTDAREIETNIIVAGCRETVIEAVDHVVQLTIEVDVLFDEGPVGRCVQAPHVEIVGAAALDVRFVGSVPGEFGRVKRVGECALLCLLVVELHHGCHAAD